jgi:uncharacterized lipoprotein YmbA
MTMKTCALLFRLGLFGCAALGFAGCSFLKPSDLVVRSFVLTALPAPAEATAPAAVQTVGIGFVKVPGYLMANSLAMRQEGNEIVYLPNARWAERLDRGLQRVIAVNLTTLRPALQARLSAWRPEEVSAEIYVTIEQFDADALGGFVLTASWRVVSPGGGELRQAGRFHTTRQGQAPDADPLAATRLMSALVAELSQHLARDLDTAGLP